MAFASSRVLIVSIICSLLVFSILLLTFRLANIDCKLLEFDELRIASSPDDVPVIASDDSSVLTKFSAYLEYNFLPDEWTANVTATSRANPQQHAHQLPPPAPPTPNGAPTPDAPAGQQNATGQSAHSSPFSTQQQQQQQQQPPVGAASANTPQLQANATLQQTTRSPKKAPKQTSKRYLQLEFSSLQVVKLNASHSLHSLSSECCVINLTMLHEPNKVSVVAGYVDMKIASKKRKTCHLDLHPNGSFAVNINSKGIAHYKCATQISYKCSALQQASNAQSNTGNSTTTTTTTTTTNNNNNKNNNNNNNNNNTSNSKKLILAHLVINYFEYEIGRNMTNTLLIKNNNFSTAPSVCAL